MFGLYGRGSLTEGASKLKKGKRECQQKGNGRRRKASWERISALNWGRSTTSLTARGGRGAISGDELRTFCFFDDERWVRLEAAAAAGFISAHGTDDD
jgi:hypothetical protein